MRLGMGPCQGGFCIYRATGILHAVDRLDGAGGRRFAALASCRSAGRASGRSSTATSCARRGWTTGSSRGCSTSSTCPTARCRHEPPRRDRRRHRARRPDRRGAARRVGRARARARQGRRRDPPQRRDDRRARLRARAGGAARRRAARLPRGAPGPPVRPRRRGRRSPRRSRGSRTASRTARSRRTPTPARSTRTCCCRRRSACRGRRRSCRRRWRAATCAPAGRCCVVGFRALKDFHPALLADTLARASGGVTRARGRARPGARGARGRQLARVRARASTIPAFRGQVVAQVVARKLGAEERVAFPAVLGIADPHGVWTALEHALGRPVFEVPTLPPSVPGMRVFAILREALRAGRRSRGAQQRGGRRGARRRPRDARCGRGSACARSGAAPTGSCSPPAASPSGGLELDSRWTARETALGLPVSGVPGPGEERFRPGYFDAHPIGRRRRRRGPRAAAGRRRRASGCWRTCWWPARRSPAPSRGGRSPATG